MKYKIKLSKETIDLLENHGSKTFSEGEVTYYFLPYWFEVTESKDEFYMHMLGNLPKELIDTLNFTRDKDSTEPLKQY